MVLVMGQIRGGGWMPLYEVPDSTLTEGAPELNQDVLDSVELYEVYRRRKEEASFELDRRLTNKMNHKLGRRDYENAG